MTDVWLTPPPILRALAGTDGFDLDPCASENRPWPTARQHFTWRENGLAQPWDGRVWLNPPYSNIAPWISRMAAHGCGTALIFAKTDTQAFMSIFDTAAAVFFINGRVRFHLPSGKAGNGRARSPSVLCAWSAGDAAVLADCGLDGRFVPLQIPRAFAVLALGRTWQAAIREWVRGQSGPVSLSDLYRAFASHPKARRNRNYKAKIRQELQRGPFQRLDRGLWSAT